VRQEKLVISVLRRHSHWPENYWPQYAKFWTNFWIFASPSCFFGMAKFLDQTFKASPVSHHLAKFCGIGQEGLYAENANLPIPCVRCKFSVRIFHNKHNWPIRPQVWTHACNFFWTQCSVWFNMKLSEKKWQTASEGRKCKHLYKPSILRRVNYVCT